MALSLLHPQWDRRDRSGPLSPGVSERRVRFPPPPIVRHGAPVQSPGAPVTERTRCPQSSAPRPQRTFRHWPPRWRRSLSSRPMAWRPRPWRPPVARWSGERGCSWPSTRAARWACAGSSPGHLRDGRLPADARHPGGSPRLGPGAQLLAAYEAGCGDPPGAISCSPPTSTRARSASTSGRLPPGGPAPGFAVPGVTELVFWKPRVRG